MKSASAIFITLAKISLFGVEKMYFRAYNVKSAFKQGSM
jgi:hypothetical protein